MPLEMLIAGVFMLGLCLGIPFGMLVAQRPRYPWE